MIAQKEFVRLKSRLTRCQNKVKKATTDVARLTAAKALVKEVDYAMDIFSKQGYPDRWVRWKCAKDDVWLLIKREGRDRP